MTNLLVVVLLDSGPLGLVTHPKGGPEAQECQEWLAGILSEGHAVLVPEICHYEVRRELRRAEMQTGVSRGLAKLDTFAEDAGIVRITPQMMRLASEYWAEARYKHFQGTSDAALDGDMILCAQAKLLSPTAWNMEGSDVIVATGNVKHLKHFADARHWRDIQPTIRSKRRSKRPERL